MNYDAELFNKLKLFNGTHKNKANEVILGVDVYRYIKNQIKHNNNPDFYKAKYDDKGILREILGMTIKIDYSVPYIIIIRHNPYLNDPIGFIWLSKEEMKKEVDDELSALMDNDLKYLHSWIKFEEYYNNRKDKEE